jgi:predicted DNA-binding protein (MmcQ/YjbR family)
MSNPHPVASNPDAVAVRNHAMKVGDWVPTFNGSALARVRPAPHADKQPWIEVSIQFQVETHRR